MTNEDPNSRLRKNRYIFASAGVILGVAMGLGMSSLTAVVIGGALGGFLGYHLMDRIGGGSKNG